MLNLEYYKEDILYNNSLEHDIEKEIFDIMDNLDGTNYDDVFTKNTSSITFNALTNIRKNIIEWYPFESNSNILEIGSEYGILTESLLQKSHKVTSIDFSKKRAKKVEKKLSQYNNLELIVGSLSDIKLQKEKFDYIILVGVIDYYSKIYKGNVIDFFTYIKSLLKKNGKILIATENRFGTKYLVGSLIEKKNSTFKMFEDNENKMFSKKMLVEIFEKINFNYNFYYPLPDYKLTNVIFSDNYMPGINDSKLMYNPNHLEGSNIILNELDMLKNFVENNNFSEFTNAFFIEINSQNIDVVDKPRFISFNNSRKEKYRLITKIYSNYVEKQSQFNSANEHFENIKEYIKFTEKLKINTPDYVENEKIKSKFLISNTLAEIVIEKLLKNDKIGAYNEIKKWENFIFNKFEINVDFENIQKNNIFKSLGIDFDMKKISNMNIIKKAYIDMVFENIFVENEKYYIYDQEWFFENTPFEFILYRAVSNLYIYNDKLNDVIKFDEILEDLDLLQYKNIFKEIENDFQKSVVDEKRNFIISNLNSEVINISDLKEEINSLKKYVAELIHDIEDYKKIKKDYIEANLELKNSIKEKDKINNDLTDELNQIYNSKTWKFIKFMKK